MHPAGHVGFAYRRISVIELKTGATAHARPFR
jgi:hypothetical protein